MAGKKNGSTSDPALQSSTSTVENGDELENKIPANEKYLDLFEKIDVDGDYDDILADYERTLDKRAKAAIRKAGGSVEEESEELGIAGDGMIEASEIADSRKVSEPEPEQPELEEAVKKEKPDVGDELYDLINELGLSVGGVIKRAWTRPKKFFRNAGNFLIYIFRLIGLAIVKFFHLITHTFVEQVKDFKRDVSSAIKYFRRSKHSPASFIAVLWYYVKKAFKTHKPMFKTIANVAMPVLAVIAFSLTVNYWSSVTFALKVSYDNKDLGYISDESVYNEASASAKARMTTTKSSESAKIEEPTYELSLVSVNELIDSSILCDRIIENSETNVTNACGIYIDDEFICAVKNETDATSVFNAILEKNQVNDANSFVDFVEKVEYIQGLYPDDETTIWDASKLKEKLSQTKQAKKTYTVQDGDTIYGIAIANGLTESQLIALNPDMGEYIHTGDQITISNEVNYVRVKVMKTETRTVEVDYETEKTNNASMFKGTTRVMRKGVKGEEVVTELVTYIDGQRISSQEVSRVRTKEPISEQVRVGTRSTQVSGSYDVRVSGRGFVWPAPACTYISSPYGWRTLYGRSDYHTGIDLTKPGGGSSGAIIVASLDGTVESVRRGNTGYGHCIVINHGGGVKTRYAHCLPGSISVSVGQHVSAGQAIARVGESGNATGPHLHFEIIINGSTVNPLPYIR